MRIGVIFPQSEITEDPAIVREYAQTAEALGYRHILAFDHVLGADRTNRPDWRGPYDIDTLFHEVFVLFGYLAGLTSRIELATGVLILPQRQTALVAKQAAEVDVLSGGRLRLGVGIGWNDVEYVGLNESFSNRGRRSEEQVQVLRKLWTEKSVTFDGRWHHIPAAGLKPMPVQRPIPIWLGGYQEETMRRVARFGDGYVTGRPDERTRHLLEVLRGYLQQEGRPLESVGIEGWIAMGAGGPDTWRETAETWRSLGATHLSFNTMNAGLGSPADHIEAIRQARDLFADLGDWDSQPK